MSNVNLINTKPNQHKKESLLINKQQLNRYRKLLTRLKVFKDCF